MVATGAEGVKPLRSQGVPIDRIVDQARLRSQSTSVRKVAKEIGMSPAGLTKVLEGSTPHNATRRKLEDWFVRYSAESESYSADAIEAALAILLRQVPEEDQDSVRSEILKAISRATPPMSASRDSP